MQKNALFYMANFDPEINRMIKAYEAGKDVEAQVFRTKVLDILNHIFSFPEVSNAGREEWTTIQNLVEGYENTDAYEKKVLSSYGVPFSNLFISKMQN